MHSTISWRGKEAQFLLFTGESVSKVPKDQIDQNRTASNKSAFVKQLKDCNEEKNEPKFVIHI